MNSKKSGRIKSAGLMHSLKAQGLPISTIIIVILVIIVLVAVGLFFFTQFAKGTNVAGDVSAESETGGNQFETTANWESVGGALCTGSSACNKIFDKSKCVSPCKWVGG